MLIKYDRPNVFVIGVPNPHSKGMPMTVKSVRLQPGINKIDDEDWKKVQKNGKVQLGLKDGWLKQMTEKDVPVDKALAEGEAPELSGMNAKEAVALVKECTAYGLLTKWQEEDERATVQTAIAKQLEKLKPGYTEE